MPIPILAVQDPRQPIGVAVVKVTTVKNLPLLSRSDSNRFAMSLIELCSLGLLPQPVRRRAYPAMQVRKLKQEILYVLGMLESKRHQLKKFVKVDASDPDGWNSMQTEVGRRNETLTGAAGRTA
jgi:hypothetical protein